MAFGTPPARDAQAIKGRAYGGDRGCSFRASAANSAIRRGANHPQYRYGRATLDAKE